MAVGVNEASSVGLESRFSHYSAFVDGVLYLGAKDHTATVSVAWGRAWASYRKADFSGLAVSCLSRDGMAGRVHWTSKAISGIFPTV